LPVDNAVVFDCISFSYGSIKVLDNVSFSIKQGDFAIFTGPNGGGKTTAVKLICSLIKPDSGCIRFAMSDKRPKIGYVAQRKPQFDYYLPMSVRDVVSLSFTSNNPFNNNSPSDENINKALRVVGLEDLQGRFVDELSGGQKQRVFIARALAMEPDVLILDEPTTGIDSVSQESLSGFIREALKLKKMTIIYVTHDISEVCGMANKRFEFADKKARETNICKV
jgi:zinc transport system ATP-binding protein